MKARWLTQIATPAVALAIAACGSGAPPPAADPSGAEATSQPPPAGHSGQQTEEPEQPESAAASDSEPDPAEETAPEDASDETEDPPDDSASGPTAPPSTVLTATGVIFMLDYNASALKEAAREKCSKGADPEPEALAKCMQKQRDSFRADAFRFMKSSTGGLRWVVYRRKGSALNEVHSVRFEFANETATTITLKPKGGTRGARPIFRGKQEVVISVPSTYRIVLDDPQFGELVYKARFGVGGR